ncbi:DNA topoisomerase VI subunit B [Methanosarcinales archaeon]|nr:MAG: DNA topoisomerase VI subunit B [Methanosarcinales archaeon]
MELGTLMSMLRRAEHTTLESFLVNSFSRIGRLTAKDVCKKAGIEPSTRPDLLGREDAIKLLDAFHSVSMKSPPVDCLSPITERLMYESIRKEYDVDFIATVTRKPSVYKGYPFLVEGAIAYGGELPKDERATILRFANKVPLLYQQSACAITNVIERMNWKLYSLQQPGGGIPVGPVVIMVHVASVNIPYLSEAKEAIAHVPEIEREIEGALREVGRKLRAYLSKKETVSKRKGKELVISKMLPLMAEKVGEVLEREPPDVEPIVAKIVGGIHIDREMDGNKVRIKVRNFSQKVQRFVLHELCEHTIKYPTPHPSENMMGNMYDYSWDIRIRPDEEVDIEYIVEGTVEGMGGKYLTILEGVEDELVVGDVDEVLEGGVKWLRSKR